MSNHVKADSNEPSGLSGTTQYALTVLTMAVAPVQLSLLQADQEDLGAGQRFRGLALRVVGPLVERACRRLQEALPPAVAVSVETRHRISGDTSLLQVTAYSRKPIDDVTLGHLRAAAMAVSDRLGAAMAEIASPHPFVRAPDTRGDPLFDEVAKVKMKGFRQDLAFAVAAGYIADAGALRLIRVPARAKSTWLQDGAPRTWDAAVILRSSRGGRQVTAAPLDGAPTLVVGVDPESEAGAGLSARAHLLCGTGSCVITIETSTEHGREAPEVVRRVHRMVNVNLNDDSQLQNLRRLRDELDPLLEECEAFATGDRQRPTRRRPGKPLRESWPAP